MSDLSIMVARGGRSSANRTITCLEARENGYDFVKTCSHCDYYLQNKALNQKALKLPRSQLSKIWQCTSLHKLGELYHSSCMGSKYRPLVPNKTNSYLCSDHGVSKATSKRVRLFSPEPEEGCSRAAVAEVEQSPNAAITISDLAIAMECQTLKEHNAILVQECDQAIGEMEDAIRGKADALKERDVAIDQMERAITACDAAKAGRYKAGVERDAALHKSDQAAKAMALLNARITALEAELEESVKKNDLMETINRALEQDKNDSSQLIATLAENVFCMPIRNRSISM